METFIFLFVLAGFYVAFQIYRGYSNAGFPVLMKYDKSGVPRLVGQIEAINFLEKRFANVEESLVFAKNLISQRFSLIIVQLEKSSPDSGYSVEVKRSLESNLIQFDVKAWGVCASKKADLESCCEATFRGTA